MSRLKPLWIALILLLPPLVMAQEIVENAELEKTYRRLIRSLYHEDMAVVEKIIHKDGFGGSDMNIPKADVMTELKNKNSELRVALRRPVDDFQFDVCRKAGEVAVSPTAFYNRYKEDYKVVITELAVDKYYQVVAQGAADDTGCRFLISGYIFVKEDNDKYYLVSDIMP